MRIAILAWGSLIYDPRNLSLASDWRASNLYLPLEFSRISHKGDMEGCLSLVVDAANGSLCSVAFAESRRADLSCVINEMVTREGVSFRSSIGYLNLKHGKINRYAERWYADHCANIADWARRHGFEGVVWTNLQSNFEDKQEVPFTPTTAISYLESLPLEKRARALRYINDAPSFVNTRVRYLVQQLGLSSILST